MSRVPISALRRTVQVVTAILAATGLLVLWGGVAVSAVVVNPNKVTICHGTNSNHNPYVVITPDKNGTVDGHAKHKGPVWDPTLKANHIDWGDIIPPFDYGVGGLQHYPGLNWPAGQAIWNAGCAIPPPALSITVVKTNNADGNATFTADETATSVGATVPFRVTVTNTSGVSVIVDSITDTVAAVPVAFTCTPVLVGLSLAPNAFATCAFTVAGYSPADGSSKTNTATVVVHEGFDGDPNDEDPNNTTSAHDSSIVRTAVPVVLPGALSMTVVKTNDALLDTVYHATEQAPTAGQNVNYRLEITNTSAVGVTLDAVHDVLGVAASVPITCATPLPVALAPNGVFVCDFTLLASSPAAGGSVTDTATVDGHETGQANNTVSQHGSSTVTTASVRQPPPPPPPPLVLNPDLKIVKTGPAGPLAPGASVTYTLTVTNDGQAAAPSVIVDDAIPAHTTLTSISSAGWTCTGAAVHCTLDTSLAVGASASLTVTLALAADYAAANVANTATVDPTDGTPADNSSTVTIAVTHSPDLSIIKSAPATVIAGDSLTWTFSVTNDGDADASSVTVTDTLPAGVTSPVISASGWTCTGTTSISCVLNTVLAPDTSAGFTISVTVPEGFTGSSISNTGVVGPTDATPADNTSTAPTTVTPFTGGGGAVGEPVVGPVIGPVIAPVVEPAAGGGELARTGAPLSRWALQSLSLVILGGGLVLLSRNRRWTGLRKG